MIHPELHQNPVALDREQHRGLRLRDDVDVLRRARVTNVVFVSASEFPALCRELPLLFVDAGRDAQGLEQAAPVAVMGLQPGENVCVQASGASGARWQGRSVPTFLRLYPFTFGAIDAKHWSVCIDESWEGWSTTEGQPLFEVDGEPSAFLGAIHEQIKSVEADVERTRVAVRLLLELELLQPRRFETRSPDGNTLTVEGFRAVDEQRLAELPEARIAELHRNGLLALLTMHQVSIGNMAELLERRWQGRMAAAPH